MTNKKKSSLEEHAYFLRENHKRAADFDHWTKKDLWTLEEAIQLLCKLEPIDDLSKLERTGATSLNIPWEIKQIIPQRIDIAKTSINTKKLKPYQISNPWGGIQYDFLPAEFLQWAQIKKFQIPDELRDIIEQPEDAPKEKPVISQNENLPTLLKTANGAWKRIWVDKEIHQTPRQKQIVPWLIKTYKISERSAQLIDNIIRPDDKKKGALKQYTTD